MHKYPYPLLLAALFPLTLCFAEQTSPTVAQHSTGISLTHSIPVYKDGRYHYNQDEYDHDSVWYHFTSIPQKLPVLLMRELPHFLGIKLQPLTNWPTVEQPTFPVRSQKPLLTWINQSSFLIQIGGYNILIDPVFSSCPPLRRTHKPGFSLEQLPPIDYILISHNHKDHTDFDTLQKIAKRDNPLFILPVGNKDLFNSYGLEKIVEKNWWETITLEKHAGLISNSADTPPLTITCLPARHWSCRKLLDANTALWSSWMIECAGFTIYCAGDSGYGPHFKEIAHEFPQIDVALMPINPIKSSNEHMGPNDAITAFLDLGAQVFVPTHWGTFSCESYTGETPIHRLVQHWAKREPELSKNCCLVYQFGETKNLQEALSRLNQGTSGIIGLPDKLPWN